MNKPTNEMIENFKQSIKAWKENEATKDLKKVYAKDRKDLMEVCKYLRSGKYKEAQQKAYWLDTIVRDQIPNGVWKFMEQFE